MEFNKLIPELTVKDIKRTREFYLNILQFKIEYERVEDKFMFLSFEDSQFMFEELRGYIDIRFEKLYYQLTEYIDLNYSNSNHPL